MTENKDRQAMQRTHSLNRDISRPSRLVLVLLVSCIGGVSMQPARAQSSTPVPKPTPVSAPKPARPSLPPNNTRSFPARFQADVVKGCLEKPKQGVANLRGYCECYANAYIKRYTTDDLIAINRTASLNPQNPREMAIMMRPEMRACAALNR